MFAKSMHLTLYSGNSTSGRAREPSLPMRTKTAFRLARVPTHPLELAIGLGETEKGSRPLIENFLSARPLCLTDLAGTVPSPLIL